MICVQCTLFLCLEQREFEMCDVCTVCDVSSAVVTWVVHGVGLGHHAGRLRLLRGVAAAARHRLEAAGHAVGRQVLRLHHLTRYLVSLTARIT